METTNLSLFDQNIRIIDESVGLNQNEFLQSEPNSKPESNPYKNLEQALSTIFPDNQEETKVVKARRILGDTAKDYSDEKIAHLVTDFEYLVECWLDVFEKNVFDGKTLQELTVSSNHGDNK